MNLTDHLIVLFDAEPGKHYMPRQIPEGFREVEIITAGRGKFLTGGNTWQDVEAGWMIGFNEHEDVEAIADARNPYSTCVFRYRSDGTFPPLPRITGRLNPAETGPFCEKARMIFSNGLADKQCWYCLEARFHWEAIQSEAADQRLRLHPALQKALARIEKDFRQEIPVSGLARHAGASEPHLYMLFRDYCGISPAQMMIRLRLEYACSLLTMTDRQVKDIAGECGFPDPKNFGFVFKRKLGQTPLEYRRRGSAKT